MNAEMSTAGLGARLGARIIDGLLVAPVIVVAQVIAFATDGPVGAVLGLVLYLAAIGFAFYNQIVRLGRTGHSFGKQWLSLRVTDERSGQPIGVGRALARDVVLGLLAAVCLLPAIVNLVVMAKDARRQGWHDKAAASVVVPIGPPRGEDDVSSEPVPASSHPPGPPPAYTPAAPPPAPGTTAPPPPAATTDDAASETISPDAVAPSTGMVGAPPGVVPPPPAPSSSAGRVEEAPAAELPAEETIMGPRAGQSAPAGAPATPAGPEWTINAPDGSSRVIAGPVLVGRDPDPALVGGAEVWAIDDARLTMSKTHALLGIDDGTAWVEDWHSTNGVALHRGEAQLVLEPHARTPLRDGDVIEFGALQVTVEAGS